MRWLAECEYYMLYELTEDGDFVEVEMQPAIEEFLKGREDVVVDQSHVARAVHAAIAADPMLAQNLSISALPAIIQAIEAAIPLVLKIIALFKTAIPAAPANQV